MPNAPAEDQAVVNAAENESAADPVDELMSRVFLSPRVVDQRAYDELAGSLKTLVRDAAVQARALEGTSAEVKLYGEQLRQATRELQDRVEGAVKVVPTIDQRVGKVEQLMDLVGRELHSKVQATRDLVAREITVDKQMVAAAVEAATRDAIATLFAEKVNGLKAQVTAMIAEQEAEAGRRVRAMTEAAEARIREMAESIAEEARKSNLQALTAERERADAAIAVLGDIVGRAESLRGEVMGHIDHLDALRAEVESVTAAFGNEVPARAREQADRVTKMGTWLNELLDQAESIGGALDRVVKRAEGVQP